MAEPTKRVVYEDWNYERIPERFDPTVAALKFAVHIILKLTDSDYVRSLFSNEFYSRRDKNGDWWRFSGDEATKASERMVMEMKRFFFAMENSRVNIGLEVAMTYKRLGLTTYNTKHLNICAVREYERLEPSTKDAIAKEVLKPKITTLIEMLDMVGNFILDLIEKPEKADLVIVACQNHLKKEWLELEAMVKSMPSAESKAILSRWRRG